MLPIGQEHHEAVDTYSEAPRRRQAVLEGTDVVLVDGMGFLITGSACSGLSLETVTLIERVIQFRERVRIFRTGDHQFEPLGEAGIVAVQTRER